MFNGWFEGFYQVLSNAQVSCFCLLALLAGLLKGICLFASFGQTCLRLGSKFAVCRYKQFVWSAVEWFPLYVCYKSF